jgi:hypothetical protein
MLNFEEKDKKIPVTFSLDPEVIAMLRELGISYGKNRSQIVAAMVRAIYAEEKKK